MPAAMLRDLVEARALAHPNVRAVGRDDSGWLTLGQLDQAASRLARLISGQGVGRGDVVGLILPRSVEFVVATFAAWKVGAAYAPIDPAAPAHHRSFVLENSEVKSVITADEAAGRATGRQFCVIGDVTRHAHPGAAFPSVPLTSEDPAWILYTSGSTGRPKGVVGSHGASHNRCTWMWESQPFRTMDVAVQNTAPSVVDSIWEVWGAVARGTPVVIPPADASLDLDVLTRLLSEHRVTRICLVPSLLRALLLTYPDLGTRLPDLELWTCSGETLDRDLAEMFHAALPGRTLLNQYGLTESCADVTTYDTGDLARTPTADARVPIGRPIRDTQIFVVDEELRPVRDGAPGELCLAGPALANGYANAPELTRGRFLVNGLGTATTIFRTGDIVRRGPDGNLYHLGRRDRQVKIRGFRVEPEGVEAVLKECSGVADAAVTVWTHEGEPRLAAYMLAEPPGSAPDPRELRERLRKDLAWHAIPSSFAVLPEFPRTPSGKIDYKLLPAPGGDPARIGSEAPAEETERSIARIWSEVLKVPAVGVRDDFFELGGHSLALMRVIARVNADHGVRLRRREVAQAPTVESMARAVRRTAATAHAVVGRPGSGGTGVDLASEIQAAMWLHEKFTKAPGLYNIQLAFRITGPLDTGALAAALEDVVTEHRALRLGFERRSGSLWYSERTPGSCGVQLGVAETSEHLVHRLLGDEGARPFDRARGPLLRAVLFKLGDMDHVLSLVVHHTVCDGQSLRPLLASLGTAYEGRSAGTAPRIPPGDTVVAAAEPETTSLPPDRFPPVELPTARPRPKQRDGHGASFELDVPRELAARIREQARLQKASPFTICCAAFAVVLASSAEQRRFAISIPVSLRGDEASERVVGCFMRTVALHLEVPEAARVPELVQMVRGALEHAYEAPSVTRVDIAGRPPQVMFAYDEAHGREFTLTGTTVVPMGTESRSSKLDLTLYMDEAESGYDCRIEYAKALFDEDAMRRFGRDYLTTLAHICDRPDDVIGTTGE